MPSQRLSIIIVGWNCSPDLATCLDSIARCPPAEPFEVVYVDNGSTDRSQEVVLNRYPWVQLVALQHNVGFQRGNNVGRQACNGDVLLLLNPDTLVTPGLLDALRAFFATHPEAAAASPRAIYPNGDLQWTVGRDPTPERVWRRIRSLHGPLRRLTGCPVPFVHADHTQEQDYAYGACLAVRAAAFDAVGGLDERYFLAGGDVALGRQLRGGGWKVYYLAHLEIVHRESQARRRVPWRSEWDWSIAHLRLARETGVARTLTTVLAVGVHLLLWPYSWIRSPRRAAE